MPGLSFLTLRPCLGRVRPIVLLHQVAPNYRRRIRPIKRRLRVAGVQHHVVTALTRYVAAAVGAPGVWEWVAGAAAPTTSAAVSTEFDVMSDSPGRNHNIGGAFWKLCMSATGVVTKQ